MKLLFSLILCVFLVTNSQAQLRHTLEIVLTVSGVGAQQSVTYTLDAIGTVWEEEDITTDYDQPQEVIVGNVSTYSYGWDWHTTTTQGPREEYAHGLYKLSTNIDDGFIYIDFRDSKYSNSAYQGGGSYSADIYIHYYGSTDEFGLKAPADSVYDIVDNQSLNRIWDIRNGGTAPLCTTFEDFWENCLGMTYRTNGNPRIVWGPHPSFSPILGYKIYRATDDDGDPETEPDAGDYSLLATVNSSTWAYIDADVKLDILGEDETWYYVKAYRKHHRWPILVYSSATNHVVAYYVSFYKSLGEKNSKISKHYPNLNQNYPNPFNPTTNISFDLPKESNVQLQIFDIQGKLISTLINETMDEGTHSVNFNSNGLPSGVYFYRLQTKEFTDIKRMLLLK